MKPVDVHAAGRVAWHSSKGLVCTESLWINPVARQRRGGMFDALDEAE